MLLGVITGQVSAADPEGRINWLKNIRIDKAYNGNDFTNPQSIVDILKQMKEAIVHWSGEETYNILLVSAERFKNFDSNRDDEKAYNIDMLIDRHYKNIFECFAQYKNNPSNDNELKVKNSLSDFVKYFKEEQVKITPDDIAYNREKNFERLKEGESVKKDVYDAIIAESNLKLCQKSLSRIEKFITSTKALNGFFESYNPQQPSPFSLPAGSEPEDLNGKYAGIKLSNGYLSSQCLNKRNALLKAVTNHINNHKQKKDLTRKLTVLKGEINAFDGGLGEVVSDILQSSGVLYDMIAFEKTNTKKKKSFPFAQFIEKFGAELEKYANNGASKEITDVIERIINRAQDQADKALFSKYQAKRQDILRENELAQKFENDVRNPQLKRDIEVQTDEKIEMPAPFK